MELWKLHKFLIMTVLIDSAAGEINLVNNGYENIIVSVVWDVQENLDLFKKLEGILTSASSVLFRATRYRLYFREFIFVIPDNWETKANYENALGVEMQGADVIINPEANDLPSTSQYAKCGSAGKNIYLTPAYILNKKVQQRSGPPGKTFVHEWGHLRWGLFDEYAQEGDDKFYSSKGKFYPTRCSNEVKGMYADIRGGKVCLFNYITGEPPNNNCKFIPFQNTTAVSSIMYAQFLDNVVEFCDDPNQLPESLKHNPLASNRQNKLCQRKSAWEVMRQHDDFNNSANSAKLPESTDTTPKFRYVRAQPKERVLVLDTSHSMHADGYLELLRQAASFFILSFAEESSQLGIVQFASTASVLSELVTIDSQAARKSLVEKLPTAADGDTSIGAGLKLGQQVLTNNGQSSGGSIILITGGGENTKPNIRDVPLNDGTVVHAFVLGQQADSGIEQLAKATGGKIFFYSKTKQSTAVIDGLTALTGTVNGMSTRNAAVPILTDAITVSSNVPWKGTFYIDSTIGKDTTLTFSYTSPITVVIDSPDGPYGSPYIKDYKTLKVITVVLDSDLTPGLWAYRLTATGDSSDIKISIESKPMHSDGEVLRIRSWVSENDDITFAATTTLEVYAEVVRGKTPIVGAYVVATVERPQQKPLTLRLHDDRIGSDIIKGDGIYSASILASDLTGNGRYSIKINVNGTKQNTRIVTASQGPKSGAADGDTIGTGIHTEPLENFQRVTTAGEFRIKGYFPITVDELAPARITDFDAKSFDFKSMEATLEWTAVGGNVDRGQAARYIMYISNDLNTILSNIQSADRIPDNKVIRGNLHSPAAPGQREEFVVHIDNALRDSSSNNNNNNNNNNDTQPTYCLSVSAVDQAGNEGQPSNIVTLSHATELSIPRGVVEPVDSDSDSNKVMYIAIGVSLACVVVIIIVVVSVVLYIRARRRKRETTANVPV